MLPKLNFSFSRGGLQKVQKIKLEIDVNPPDHSVFEYTYLDFPLDFEICHQDLSSNFALKLHAILCRPYVKGRDWYDFNWYIKKSIQPNLPHLQKALDQWGPWENQGAMIDITWLRTELERRKILGWEFDRSPRNYDSRKNLKGIRREYEGSLYFDDNG